MLSSSSLLADDTVDVGTTHTRARATLKGVSHSFSCRELHHYSAPITFFLPGGEGEAKVSITQNLQRRYGGSALHREPLSRTMQFISRGGGIGGRACVHACMHACVCLCVWGGGAGSARQSMCVDKVERSEEAAHSSLQVLHQLSTSMGTASGSKLVPG